MGCGRSHHTRHNDHPADIANQQENVDISHSNEEIATPGGSSSSSNIVTSQCSAGHSDSDSDSTTSTSDKPHGDAVGHLCFDLHRRDAVPNE